MKEYRLDVLNRRRMGQYLTSVEADFIDKCLQQELNVHSILDVGGGYGRFAIPLENKGYRVTVTEVNSRPLRYLKARSPHTDAVLTSPQTRGWPIRDSSMDCVMVIEVSVVRFHWFWQECYRVLRPRGIVIACLYSNSCSYKGALYRIRPILRPFLSKKGKKWADRRSYELSARTIVQMFEEDGLHLERALGFNWLPAGRGSNSFLVPLSAAIEQRLGLRDLAFQSPWVLVQARAC